MIHEACEAKLVSHSAGRSTHNPLSKTVTMGEARGHYRGRIWTSLSSLDATMVPSL